MEPEPARRRDAHAMRVALLGIALFLLLGIVALASRGGFGNASTSRPAPGYVSWALSVFLILFVMMIPVAAWLYLHQQRQLGGPPRSFQARIVRNFAGLGAVMLLG